MTVQDGVRAGSAVGAGYESLVGLVLGTAELPAGELHEVVDAAGRLLGADSARLLVADYGLLTLQELGADGPTGDRQAIDGTLAGRALVQDEVVVHGTDPAIVSVPLADGHELMGVFELTHPSWTDDLLEFLAPVVRLLALVLISKRRYTDVVHRTRRVKPLSVAAELQWDLLPPLACTTACVSVSGILEPAYSIGGDSFDYAMNEDRVEFAIVDAVGHGMPAVLLSTSAINCLRNARREGADLAAAYRATGDVIETQFAHSYFVTAQLGSLAFDTGELTWLNAGHPPPLLVRDCTYLGELACAPSLPMGLGGLVREVATERLQRGDRILFYTDGVTEMRSPEGKEFGTDRLADFLVRATLDRVSPAETVRRLSASVVAYNEEGRTDDATLMLLEYHGPRGRQ
jgi:hypothetical protein